MKALAPFPWLALLGSDTLTVLMRPVVLAFGAAAVGCSLLVPLDSLQNGRDSGAGGLLTGGGRAGFGGAGAGTVIGNNAGGAGGDAEPIWVSADCASTAIATGREWYVSVSGLDTATGNEATPLASLRAAAALAKSGDVIRLGAGEFNELATVALPRGVALTGAGERATTLRVAEGDAVLSLADAAANLISQLSIDGNARVTPVGLRVTGARGLTLSYVQFKGFSRSAVTLSRGKTGLNQVLVCRSSFSACAAVDMAKQPYVDTACISSEPLTNSRFADLKVHEDRGAGIYIQGSTDGSDKLSEMELLGLDVQVPDFRGGSFAPQYSLAIRNVNFDGVRIASSRFNQPVAVWQQDSTAPQRLEITTSRFEPRAFALELDVDDALIHHNYFHGGYYPFFNVNNGGPRNGIRVHHNVFDKLRAPTLLVHFEQQLSDFGFFNNTVELSEDTGDAPLFNVPVDADCDVRNNIFFSTGKQLGDVVGLMPGAKFTTNIVYRLGATNFPDNLRVDPKLAAIGDVPEGFFIPAPGSPAIGAGVVIPGIADSAPVDLGACAHDEVHCLGLSP